jgi:hypothetical protein
MKKYVLICLILASIAFSPAKANGIPDNAGPKSCLALQLFGPEALGLYYNHYLTKYVSVNAGIGLGGNAHLGSNFYPIKVRPATIYVGLQVCRLTRINLNSLGKNYGGQAGLYFPIGVQLTSAEGITLMFEGGYNWFKDDYYQRNTQPFLFTFRVGKTWFNKQK